MPQPSIVDSILAFYPALPITLQVTLSTLGGLVILGQTYIAATPTKQDDAWYARLEAKPGIGNVLRVLKSFAPIQRKGE